MFAIKTASIERQKLWLLTLLAFGFVIAFAVTLNRISFIRLKSDIYLRWYATVKLFEEGRNLYDPRNGEEVDQIVYGRDSGMESGYYYPAHLTLFIGPLARLPYPTAHLIWTIAIQLFFLVGLTTMIREADWPRTINQITLFSVLVTLSIPSLQHTIWGQFNTIGVLTIGLVYAALRRERYWLAGILATGFTFKPHTFVLTILFLGIWAMAQRRRWPFLIGFAGAGLILGLLPTIFQPTWVFDFFGALDEYIPVVSMVDQIWNPYQLVSGLLVAGAVALFIRQRQAESNDPEFAGCLALSLSLWMLVVPVVGMFHLLALPLAVIPLLKHYQEQAPYLFRLGVATLLVIYLLGLLTFLVGLSGVVPYGLHIDWTQWVYRGLLTLAIGLLALPICFPVLQRKPGWVYD